MALSFKADLILLGNSIELHQGAADPSAGGGVAAPVGSLYYRTSTSTLWQKVGSANTAWVYLTPRDLFGTGTDGDLLVNGGTTTAAADGVYNDVHVTSTGIWKTGGYRHWIRGQLLVDAGGIVNNDGVDAVSNAAPGAAPAQTVGNTFNGGAGGATTSPGSNGVSATNTPASFTGTGGNGGAGNAGANAGGTGGTVATMGATRGRIRNFSIQQLAQGFGGTNTQNIGGGAGGGGGGGGPGGGAAGGAGGSGGGFVVLTAREIINNGTIRSKGGNGFGPAANAGGGGGGGGGVVWLAFHYFEGNAPSVVGGTRGTATGTGASGVDGGSGLYVPLQM